MNGETDSSDKKEARRLAIALIALLIMLAIGAVFALPLLGDFHQSYLAPGMGIKDAAIVAFVSTIVVLIVFAVAAGDGLLGELQFILPAFGAFFVVLWLLISWVF